MTKTLLFMGLSMAALFSQNVQAQVRKATDNKLSPSASTSVQLAGHAVRIEYNAPSARGRKVEGGLIPYGEVWRTGADAATTLTTDAPLMIGTLKVPKGSYTLYTLASEKGWQLIVNRQTGQWGTEYSQAQDLGRVPLKVEALSAPVEKFVIELKGSGNSGTLELKWGKTAATTSIRVAQ